jgi:Flp pilus assembly protein TadG
MRTGILRETDGQTIIEFALASAMFFATIFGILEYGQAVWRSNMVSTLAQEGARWAAVRGGGASGGISPAYASDVQTYVSARAVGLSVVATTYTVDANKNCTTTTTDPRDLSAGDGVCVKVTNTFQLLTAFIPHASLTFHGTAQMTMAR